MTSASRTQPLLTIAIPTYNGADLLPFAIDSVLRQSFADFELLVCDNASADATESIVAAYQDPRIRYLRSPVNLGAEGNWNRCLAESRGKYIKLLPHDDVILPGCLEQQVATLEQDTQEAIALVFCARRILVGEKPLATRGYPFAGRGRIAGRRAIKRCVRMGTNLIGEPGGVMFRRSLAEKIGAFDGEFGFVMDLDYWFRLMRHGEAFYLPEPLAMFRVSGGSWSTSIGKDQASQFRRFAKRAAADPGYGLTAMDLRFGNLTASINNSLRLAFYKWAPAVATRRRSSASAVASGGRPVSSR